MQTFDYKAFDADGAARRGLVEADNPKEARARLAARGLMVQRLHAVGDPEKSTGGRRAFRRPSVRSAIYRELASLLRAGLPLTRALDLLIESPEMKDCRGLLAAVRDRVKEG
ncbi:MAG: type II secretion system protein GspF, partial [Kiritimatiellia bacterium]|nr:type II secretion system protein GspF [Kiritimatiellia bacterium]